MPAMTYDPRPSNCAQYKADESMRAQNFGRNPNRFQAFHNQSRSHTGNYRRNFRRPMAPIDTNRRTGPVNNCYPQNALKHHPNNMYNVEKQMNGLTLGPDQWPVLGNQSGVAPQVPPYYPHQLPHPNMNFRVQPTPMPSPHVIFPGPQMIPIVTPGLNRSPTDSFKNPPSSTVSRSQAPPQHSTRPHRGTGQFRLTKRDLEDSIFCEYDYLENQAALRNLVSSTDVELEQCLRLSYDITQSMLEGHETAHVENAVTAWNTMIQRRNQGGQ